MTNFIGRYKNLHSQITYPMTNDDVQRIFTTNLQNDIRDKLLFSKFSSSIQLYGMLHNYQLQVSQFEISSSMAPIDKNESTQQLFQKFQKQKKGFIKINDNSSNHRNTQVAATISGVAPLSSKFMMYDRVGELI